jgi:hypothetical protein
VATAPSATYLIASGASVNAGRFAGGRLAGGLTVDDAVLSGTMESVAVEFNAFVGIWGQSNAIGRALRSDISASPLSSDAGLATYDSGTFDRVWIWTGSVFAKLQPSVNNQALTGQFGPEFGLAVRWMRETSTGDLYILKNGYGGQSIVYFEPTAGTGYLNGETEHVQAEAWLTSNAPAIDQRAMIWIQGESDETQTESWYRTRLNALVSAMVSDGIRGASDKLILAQMHPSTDTYGIGVAAAKAAYVTDNPTFASAPEMPFYMKADNIHTDGRGQVQMGNDYAATLFGFPAVSV